MATLPATLPRWEPWERGFTGKGVMTPLGRVYAWRTNDIDDYNRSHATAMQKLRMNVSALYSDRVAAFVIDEDGALDIHYAEGDHHRERVLAAHPDWHDADGVVAARYYD